MDTIVIGLKSNNGSMRVCLRGADKTRTIERQHPMIRVITDSTSSIPADIREGLGIEVLSLVINRGGKSYVEAETNLDAFYQDIYEMVDDIPTSSQPSPEDAKELLERIQADGDEALGIFISSKMSGTFETFLRMAREVAQGHPGFKFAVIDSMTNCMELGHAVLAAAQAARDGQDLQACAAAAENTLYSGRFLFTPESLRFLEKGGRIGRAAALIGNVMSIAPILTVKDGEASTAGKTRTQKKAMAKIVKMWQEDVAACGLKNLTVHYIGSKAPAEEWAEEVINPLAGFRARVVPASPVIGVHVGPAVGIAYECAERINGKFTDAAPEVVVEA